MTATTTTPDPLDHGRPYPTAAELRDCIDDVLDALDTGCTTDEVRASAEATRGGIDAVIAAGELAPS